ncbi:hypothetical protein [Actinomadura sp.]|jgi:hypothetical protein|uniref:hypothetical protein n=1 Tax=Actinomadura sp. TaxID=1989 RepID=UPI003344E91C
MGTKRRLPVLAALFALGSTLVMVAPSHAATTTQKESPSSATSQRRAWIPKLQPFFPDDHEDVIIKVDTATRNNLLHTCPTAFVCLTVGRGDGYHDYYRLYNCTQRSLMNFIGEDALTNAQIGNASVVLKDRWGGTLRIIPADPDNSTPVRVDWDEVWYIDPC